MSFNAKDMTQGGQIASMRFRMFGQIANIIFYCLFLLFWTITALTLIFRLSWQTFVNGLLYWWCNTLGPLRELIRSQPVYHIEYYGRKLTYNAQQILDDNYTAWCGEQLWTSFVIAAVIGGAVCIMTFFIASWILGHQGKKQSEDDVTGGRQLTDDPKVVATMLKKDGNASDIKIENLPLIKDSEIQNFCLHGTVGSGKSEFVRRLMNHARKRGDMVIVYDRSCEFIKSYYDPSKDKILNPLDSRCAAWDLWRECLTQPDFDNVANTLIPMGTSEDPFWQGSGRTIFAEAAYLMRKDGDRSYAKLVDTLLSIKIDKLRAYLKSSPAANLVEEKIEKTAISIRAVLTNYVKLSVIYRELNITVNLSLSVTGCVVYGKMAITAGYSFHPMQILTHHLSRLSPCGFRWRSAACWRWGKTVSGAYGFLPMSCQRCTSSPISLKSCQRHESLVGAMCLASSHMRSWKISMV